MRFNRFTSMFTWGKRKRPGATMLPGRRDVVGYLAHSLPTIQLKLLFCPPLHSPVRIPPPPPLLRPSPAPPPPPPVFPMLLGRRNGCCTPCSPVMRQLQRLVELYHQQRWCESRRTPLHDEVPLSPRAYPFSVPCQTLASTRAGRLEVLVLGKSGRHTKRPRCCVSSTVLGCRSRSVVGHNLISL